MIKNYFCIWKHYWNVIITLFKRKKAFIICIAYFIIIRSTKWFENTFTVINFSYNNKMTFLSITTFWNTILFSKNFSWLSLLMWMKCLILTSFPAQTSIYNSCPSSVFDVPNLDSLFLSRRWSYTSISH